MEQINIRVQEEEKRLLQALAAMKGVSVPEFVKQAVLKEIAPVRVDIAFQLLKEGKIGRKRAWMLSGLPYPEFMVEWSKRGAEEVVPEEAIEREILDAGKLDMTKFLRKKTPE